MSYLVATGRKWPFGSTPDTGSVWVRGSFDGQVVIAVKSEGTAVYLGVVDESGNLIQDLSLIHTEGGFVDNITHWVEYSSYIVHIAYWRQGYGLYYGRYNVNTMSFAQAITLIENDSVRYHNTLKFIGYDGTYSHLIFINNLISPSRLYQIGLTAAAGIQYGPVNLCDGSYAYGGGGKFNAGTLFYVFYYDQTYGGYSRLDTNGTGGIVSGPIRMGWSDGGTVFMQSVCGMGASLNNPPSVWAWLYDVNGPTGTPKFILIRGTDSAGVILYDNYIMRGTYDYMLDMATSDYGKNHSVCGLALSRKETFLKATVKGLFVQVMKSKSLTDRPLSDNISNAST